MYFAGLAFFLGLMFLFVYDPLPEMLIVSHNDSSANGGPLTVLNTETGERFVPSIPAIGCNGINRLPASVDDTLQIYCAGSRTDTPHFAIDLRTRVVSTATLLPEPFSKPSVMMHSRSITSGKYSFFTDDSSVTDPLSPILSNAGVIISGGNETTKVFISDRSKGLFILRMVYDETRNELWLMSMGDAETVLIDRINIGTQAVNYSRTIKAYSGYDMIRNDKDLVITTYRTKEGNDITILDTKSGSIVKEISLDVKQDLGYNAYSLLVHKNNLYVAREDGLLRLDTETYEVQEFITNNTQGQFTSLVSGKNEIFAIDAYNRVLEINDQDLYDTKLLLEAPTQGLTNLFYIHN